MYAYPTSQEYQPLYHHSAHQIVNDVYVSLLHHSAFQFQQRASQMTGSIESSVPLARF